MNGLSLSQLPERFQRQPRSAPLQTYIDRKYSKFGYAKSRSIEYNPEWTPEHSRDKYRFVENVEDGLRKVDDADKIIRLNHTGWFTDNFQDETIHGEVYQLPARNGQCLYISAVNDPNNEGCACLDFSSVTEDKEDAARWADSMAERWAEREREYQAEESAKQRLEEIEDEIKQLYSTFRQVARDLRADCDKVQGLAVVRQLVRNEWKRTKAAIHKLRAERSRIQQYGMEY